MTNAARETSPKPRTPFAQAGVGLLGLAGMILGGILGAYAGGMFILPGIAGVATLFALNRTRARANPFLLAVAVVVGQGAWMTVAAVALDQFGAVALDLAAFGIGAVWLIARPAWPPAVLLVVFQGIAAALNAGSLIEENFGTTIHKALTAHIVLRIASVILLLVGMRVLTRDEPTSSKATGVASPESPSSLAPPDEPESVHTS